MPNGYYAVETKKECPHCCLGKNITSSEEFKGLKIGSSCKDCDNT